MVWSMGRGVLAAAGIAVLAAGAIVVSEDAEATHFWSGTLSWETMDPTGAMPELAVKVTGYIGFDNSPIHFPSCDAPQEGMVRTGDGTLTVDGSGATYAIKIEYVDNGPKDPPDTHCRYSGRIVDPVTGDGVLVPLNGKQSGDVVTIRYNQCCREDQNHPNNANKRVQMESTILIGDPNHSPIIDFPALSRFTSHGDHGYGNHHCPQNAVCKFYIEAHDPDNDTLSYRLGDNREPVGTGPDFVQPPGMTIDPQTGLIEWDTSSVSVGKVYSAHVIVEDGIGKVPVDFMIEMVPGCENGAKGVVDPFTGELICEGPVTPPPPPEECEEHPDADGCRPVPPRPSKGKPYQHRFWPPDQRHVPLAPAVSDSRPVAAAAGDATVSDLSGLDSDGDDISDAEDLCPGEDTLLNVDTDGDGRGDGCDDDDDGDGIIDKMDACPQDADTGCGIDASGRDAEESGADTARGFFVDADAPAGGAGDADVQEASSRKGSTLHAPILVGLAAAVLLLLVATRRRPDP